MAVRERSECETETKTLAPNIPSFAPTYDLSFADRTGAKGASRRGMLERMPCAQASGPGEPSKARHTPLASRPRGLACGSQQRPFIYDSAFGWPLRASPCEPGSLPRPELHSFHVSRQLFLVSRRPGAHGLQAMERKFRSWLAPVRQRRDPLAPLG